MSTKRKNRRIGVIIGRFQVPNLHEGHLHLINYVRDRSTDVIVLIGDSEKIDYKNPLPYAVRYRMFEKWLQHVTADDKQSFQIVRLVDVPGDNKYWSQRVEDLVMSYSPWTATPSEVTLYGGRDSFIPSYNGRLKVVEVPSIEAPSGTAVRAEIEYENTTSFRRGMIAAVNAIYGGS